MTPCVCGYFPVKKLPRLGEQSGIETKKFLKSAPSLAIRSMFGVFANGCPMQPNASQRKSSIRMKIMFGRAAELAAKEEAEKRSDVKNRNITVRGNRFVRPV